MNPVWRRMKQHSPSSGQNGQQKTKYNAQQQKEIDCDEPIWRRLKQCNPSSGQNGQLVHWWLLVHFGPSSHPWYLKKGFFGWCTCGCWITQAGAGSLKLVELTFVQIIKKSLLEPTVVQITSKVLPHGGTNSRTNYFYPLF
jgi:hypothetical protein